MARFRRRAVCFLGDSLRHWRKSLLAFTGSDEAFDAGELAMIKNLLEQYAEQPERKQSEMQKTAGESASETAAAPQYVEVNEAEDLLELTRDNDPPAAPEISELAVERTAAAPAEKSEETANFTAPSFNPPIETTKDAGDDETVNYSEKNFDQFETNFNAADGSPVELKDAPDDFTPPVETATETANSTFDTETVNQPEKTENADVIARTNVEPQSFAETARQSGLAYAAAITLFASVVFMLIIGWFADLLFGTSPWGKVVGIVVGALIGFAQLFRITSQIFKK